MVIDLVAGGAGFIGSHLCEHLLRRGSKVICVDNLSTGNWDNIAELVDNPAFRFCTADVVGPLPSLRHVDRVFHLASPASPIQYRSRSIGTLRANSEGTRQLLELAVLHRARFVYVSTSEVYGDPLQHPQREDYWGNVNPTGPRSMYDEAKRYGEAICAAFAQTYDLDVRVARLFNVYGPRADPEDGRLVPNFITQALEGRPLTIYGTGRQTRSLCYVSDIVDALELLMVSPAAPGATVNIGNPDERSILEFANLIRHMSGSTSEIQFAPQPVGDDPQRRRPDIAKARTLLRWEPKISIEKGLSQTIEYFRANRRSSDRVPEVLAG